MKEGVEFFRRKRISRFTGRPRYTYIRINSHGRSLTPTTTTRLYRPTRSTAAFSTSFFATLLSLFLSLSLFLCLFSRDLETTACLHLHCARARPFTSFLRGRVRSLCIFALSVCAFAHFFATARHPSFDSHSFFSPVSALGNGKCMR